mmetsp:Transcript_730/g.859  ORF Transcript_730/g.859 Transcript_730/m.859 type:complete len:397 (-) Transcript_730:37-1227(-)
MKLVQETLHFVVQQLKAEDGFSIVSYDAKPKVELPLKKMTKENKELARDAIKNMKVGSMTNMSGGLLMGISQLINREKGKGNDVSTIIVFTDGKANVGIRSKELIARAVENTTKDIDGVCSIFCMGFGSDHSQQMLRSISEAGNGMYYFIEHQDDIPESFGDCVGGLLSIVAQNLKLTVTAVGDCKLQKVLTTYPSTLVNDVGIVELHDLYSEESRDLMFTACLPEATTLTEAQEVLEYKLEYFSVLSCSMEVVKSTATIKRTSSLPPGSTVTDYFVDRQKNRLAAAEALENARKVGDDGDLAAARKILNVALTSIKQSISSKDELCKGMINDLEDCLLDMQDKRQYGKASKKMAWKGQIHGRQRCAYGAGTRHYTNKAKTKLRSDMKSHFSKEHK